MLLLLYHSTALFPSVAFKFDALVAHYKGWIPPKLSSPSRSNMTLLRQPFKVIRVLGLVVTTLFIRLPFWFIYYSWRPNRPRKNWTLRRTINVQILRQVTKLPMRFGVLDGRDLSAEVPQKELEPFNARFVWIPQLQEEDIVGIVAEHATRAGVKSIAIPAYWILKEGCEWTPEHGKALKDEKTMLYFHGGAFVVSFFSVMP